MKITPLVLLVFLFVLYSCRSVNLINVQDLDLEKWSELEKISSETDRGYKFVKTTFENGQYNTMIVTKSNNMKITSDDKRKIEKILHKYE